VTLRVLLGAVLGAVVAGSTLVACGAEAPPATYDAAGPPADTSAPKIVKPVADPAAISIPKIGAHSELIKLGLNADGSLQTPPVDQPGLGGWFAGARPDVDGDEIAPGERGSSVVAAHVDGVIDGKKGQPGLFFKLRELVPGDEVFISQADGGQLRFLVERVASFDKSAFPSAEVYEAADMPRLNLVTCGGPFQRDVGHYRDNLVIFTTLAPEQL